MDDYPRDVARLQKVCCEWLYLFTTADDNCLRASYTVLQVK